MYCNGVIWLPAMLLLPVCLCGLFEQNVELVCGFCRQQALLGSEVHKVTMNLDEHPAIGLSDFEAALKEYQPTQWKAANLQ